MSLTIGRPHHILPALLAIGGAALLEPLAQFSVNIGKVSIFEPMRAWLFLLVAGLLLLVFLRLFRLSLAQSALLVVAAIILFYAELPFRSLLKALGFSAAERVRWGIWIVIGVWVSASALIIACRNFSQILCTLVSVTLPTMGVLSSYDLYTKNSALEQRWSKLPAREVVGAKIGHYGTPNIYYIMLDGFGRADTLFRIYNVNAAPFIERLEKLGFVTASASTANYPQTLLSLNASLGMRYLNKFTEVVGRGSRDRGFLRYALRTSPVVTELKKLGYATYMLPSGYSATDLRNFDYRYSTWWTPGEFGQQMISTSLAHKYFSWVRNFQFAGHRAALESLQTNLVKIAALDAGPRFVFGHLLAPHPPFSFLADGSAAPNGKRFRLHDGSHLVNDNNRAEYVAGYAGQVQWVMASIASTAEKIVLADPNCIIILHGDHGPGSLLNWESAAASDLSERFAIFNSYRFPPAVAAKLYPEITPVNSFRLLFSEIFSADTPLVPDRNYFAKFSAPFVYYDVTERLQIKMGD